MPMAPGAHAQGALLLFWALPLLVALAEAGAVCQQRFPLPRAIDNLAVSPSHLLVAGGSCLYELEPSLRRTVRELHATGSQDCAQPPGTVSKLLLPYGEGAPGGGFLLTCWTLQDGICQLRNLTGGELLSSETQVASCLPQGSTAGVVVQGSSGSWYLAVAATYFLASEQSCSASSDSAINIHTLQGTNKWTAVLDDQMLKLKEGKYLYFVDAFLWRKHIFFPYYHHYNANAPGQPSVAIIKQPDGSNPISFYGQGYLQCANKTKILSSSVILSEQRGLWAGVFSPHHPLRSSSTTALCIFDLEQVMKYAHNCSSEDFSLQNQDSKLWKTVPLATEKTVPLPTEKSYTIIHSDLSSVYATVVLNKIVLFLGTGNGQLLKVILDENMKPNCPEVLYEIEEETPVFHKLALDPVDDSYIYLSAASEVRRIQVADCSKYVSCQECISAKDPHCGWCYLNQRCTLKRNCSRSDNSRDWVDILYEADKCLKIQITPIGTNTIVVTAVGNFSILSERLSTCQVKNIKTNHQVICQRKEPEVMNCSCNLGIAEFTDNAVEVLLTFASWNLSETFEFYKCSSLEKCSECISTAGCTWCTTENKCVSPARTCKQVYAKNQDDCHQITKEKYISDTGAPTMKDVTKKQKPMHIISIEPAWISVLGKKEVIVRGENFTGVSNIVMEMTGTSSCKPYEIHVTKVLNNTHMKFSLPTGRKEVKSVCIKADGVNCSSPITLYYVSLPMCSKIFPNISWISGGRKINITGRSVNVTDNVIVSDGMRSNFTISGCPGDISHCSFLAPSFHHAKGSTISSVILEVEKYNIHCSKLYYHPDPVFTGYELTTDMDPFLDLKLFKENDNLNISKSEIEVSLSHGTGGNLKNITFTVQNITQKPDRSIILCKFKSGKDPATSKIDPSTVKVYVKFGNIKREVQKKRHHNYLYALILIPFLALIVTGVAIIVTRYKSKELTNKLTQRLDEFESELRKEIREEFAELQMDKLDVVDSFGTVPFLDYKHFALRTFFPESGGLAAIFTEDMHTNVPSRNSRHKDESLTALYALICDKDFLVTLIHTLEKQKNFSVKDRCLFASFLTIALQTKLVYFTQILEILTRDLMEQSSNIQPKLMLRRTESVVEKLLTNWMSVCLSGFLRETFGEPFYLLVTTLDQRISKGPVDVITCKALYTLNEDWLLWQVTEFSMVALNVVFEKIPENESADISWNIQVNVLDCDSIGQAKEKIFHAFLNKNGFSYGLKLNETVLELQSSGQQRELLDIDSSSAILEDGITRLNTIGHYKITDGATIKVFKKEVSFTSDVEYADEHCHLILPHSEEVKEMQIAKGKQKFKVKEMYLTKLLSTKVAVHSVVEKLFRSIWSLPNNKAPIAIKYFFDFLDAQAENRKITDPDVVHIWKTNSLPLRFWVNILKNPQFVFDIKKTPHIDGCLSVIAQAFMDAFSLAEQQLGKAAPTNKLLYAKDIPLYKEEVKAYYKAIRDLPPLTSTELEEFLNQESKKHENEFNEEVALSEIYKYIARYSDEILSKLEKEWGLEEAYKQLLQITALINDKKKCKWI